MKKRIMAVAMLTGALMLGGCGNKDMFDTIYTFNKAIIELANGEVIEVNVKQWRDYEGEQLQVIAEDGTVYLTNSFRCDLIRSE